ncbi:MAG: AlpA family phage regulatory protein [Phenylobacterium sp.]|uniref:helix-turn-helix transcriptional regulator n=1 Tax=Phenylobacterium sp. TaxID=1871053 RepID=UPI001A59F200|nr:AlpA family phage regulatory protein [Phenylobacterium sp.]MBL8770539.1 AlpA family phage regulatory protein [Phenylobacterium sp.]
MPNWKDFVDPDAPSGRYLRWKEVERSAGISRTTAWRLQRAGDFPRPYVISPGRVGYLEAEVEAWRRSRGHRGAESAVPRPRLVATATPARPPSSSKAPAAQPPADRGRPALARPPAPKQRLARARRPATHAQMQLDL